MWIKTRVGYQYIYYTRSESIKSCDTERIRSTTDSCRQSWHRLSEEWTLPLRIELPYREGRLLRIWIDFENYLNGRTHLRVDGSNGKESSRVWGERTMGPSSSVHASGWEKHPIIIFYQNWLKLHLALCIRTQEKSGSERLLSHLKMMYVEQTQSQKITFNSSNAGWTISNDEEASTARLCFSSMVTVAPECSLHNHILSVSSDLSSPIAWVNRPLTLG